MEIRLWHSNVTDNLPINKLRFFPVRFHKNSSTTNKMRISFCQNHLHSIGTFKRYKTEHSFLLAGDPYILN